MAQQRSPAGLDLYWVNQYAVPPDQPGGTRHYDFAAELGRRGHRVHLIASDLSLSTRRYSRRSRARDLRAIDENVGDVDFTWLSAGSYRGNDWRRLVSMVVFGLAVFAHLLRVKRHGRATVFIGSSPHLFAALGTWAAARLRRVPFVFEVRDLWPESYSAVSGRDHGPDVRLMQWIADLLYRQARSIIVLAGPNAERIEARGIAHDKIVNVPNGVDLRGFTEGDAAVDLHCDGRFTFVYAGAHGPANNLETVVRAAKILDDRDRDDIRVVLLGDGATKADLIALARREQLTNVEFVNPVAKADIGATLSTADAGLMVLAPVDLFSYGVSPNKLFDYLGAGLPVLTNVAGLVADVVTDADVGRCVAGGDPVALADGIVAMVDHPTSGADVRGPAFIAEHYERQTLVTRIEAVLTTLASEP